MRKTLPIYIIILTCLSIAAAGKNLLINGDFEKGRNRWSGDLELSMEGDNKICKLELEDDEDVSFYQKISILDVKEITLRYKVKTSADYKGEGIGLRFESTGTMVTSRQAPNDNEWHLVKLTYSNSYNWKRIKVIFIAKKGVGTIYFDDIEVTTKN